MVHVANAHAYRSAMLFSDICGFTKLSSQVTPKQVGWSSGLGLLAIA
jgi:class 3 adenylate cyclase